MSSDGVVPTSSADFATVDPSATNSWEGEQLLQANLRSPVMSRMAYECTLKLCNGEFATEGDSTTETTPVTVQLEDDRDALLHGTATAAAAGGTAQGANLLPGQVDNQPPFARPTTGVNANRCALLQDDDESDDEDELDEEGSHDKETSGEQETGAEPAPPSAETAAAGSELPKLPSAVMEELRQMIEGVPDYNEPHHTHSLCSNRKVQDYAWAFGMSLHDEWKFKVRGTDGDEHKPRTDVVFVEYHEQVPEAQQMHARRSSVALIEVGKSKKIQKSRACKFWMEKFGQGVKYLNLMAREDDSVAGQKRPHAATRQSSDGSFVQSESSSETEPASQMFGKLSMGKPVLFYTIIYAGEHADDQEDSDPDDEECARVGENDEEQTAMIGCFIAEKKPHHQDAGTNKYDKVRLSLLYRKNVKGQEPITTALCTVLQQICWFKNFREQGDQTSWKYLGPNCALVTFDNSEPKVYRAYDSRPWRISRSPQVYQAEPRCVSTEITQDGSWDENEGKYQIFDFRGKLTIIRIPFVNGSHVPQSWEQLIDVAKDLQQYHNRDIVHGDPRLLNFVFGNPSKIIDFDFGGFLGNNPTYPPGYRRALEDGRRIGMPGNVITKYDDVHGLMYAFDHVIKYKNKQWQDLLRRQDKTIDQVIAVLQGNEDKEVEIAPELLTYLASHSKFHRTQNKTMDGDPLTPERIRMLH